MIPAADIAAVTATALAALASENVCSAYCSAIGAICRLKDENRVACGVAVITAVLAMMGAHPESAEVQQEACKALARLAANGVCAAHMRGRAAALLRHALAPHLDSVISQRWAKLVLMWLEQPEVILCFRLMFKLAGPYTEVQLTHSSMLLTRAWLCPAVVTPVSVR